MCFEVKKIYLNTEVALHSFI